jgi:hypothetical protein
MLEAQDLAYASHRHSLRWHRIPPAELFYRIEGPRNPGTGGVGLGRIRELAGQGG